MIEAGTDRVGVWVFADRTYELRPSLLARPGIVEFGALTLAVGVMWAPPRRRGRV